MTLTRPHRRAGALLVIAAWLFALACTSAYACELGTPAQHDCCETVTVLDAQCGAHCGFEGQAPSVGWPDVAQPALGAPVLRVTALVPTVRAHPPPATRGASPPLTILLHRLRN